MRVRSQLKWNVCQCGSGLGSWASRRGRQNRNIRNVVCACVCFESETLVSLTIDGLFYFALCVGLWLLRRIGECKKSMVSCDSQQYFLFVFGDRSHDSSVLRKIRYDRATIRLRGCKCKWLKSYKWTLLVNRNIEFTITKNSNDLLNHALIDSNFQ